MANTMALISSVTVGAGGAANIDFTSIPATYTDLQIVYSLRDTTTAGVNQPVAGNFNGSTTGFTWKQIYGTGSAAGSNNDVTPTFGSENGTGSTASTFTNGQVYIPNYAGSTYKSYSVDCVVENNATAGVQQLIACLWSNTAAITSIRLTAVTAFTQYSTAYLYGVKNA
jgi:hypothetical protein